jgi:hypothetical protein
MAVRTDESGMASASEGSKARAACIPVEVLRIDFVLQSLMRGVEAKPDKAAR